MFYLMQPDKLTEAYQSWFASLRDQATVQLMAATAMQHKLQHNMAKSVEASATMLDHQFEASIEPVVHQSPEKANVARSKTLKF